MSVSDHCVANGIERDEHGFLGFTCQCGYVVEGCPDEETLIDEALAHGYNAGVRAAL